MRTRNLTIFSVFVTLSCFLLLAAPVTTARKTTDLGDQIHILNISKAVPNKLNYQGFLVNAADSSTVTATLQMTFRLCDSETKGAQLWAETHSTVEVNNGLFQVLLGSITPFPDGLFDGSALWLQTEVGTEILSPRKPLVSVAYSQHATDADQLEGQALTDLDDRWVNQDQISSVTSDMITNGEIADADVSVTADIHPGKISGTAWTSNNDGGGSGLDADLVDGLHAADFSGVDDLDHLDAHDGDPANAVYVDGDGKVGMGTTSPAQQLDVNGAIKATTYYGDGSNLSGISGTPDADWTVAGNHVYSAVPGSVGIGTSSPESKLHVAGDMKATTYYGDGSNLTGISGTTDNDWTISGDNIYHQTGNVGIGTSSMDEKLHIENSASGGSAFLKIETSHATNWHEAGIRIETPQNRWHLRMDDDANNNIPDGALGLRSQDLGAEVMVWQEDGNVGIGTPSPAARAEVRHTNSAGNAGYFHIDNAANDSSALYATTNGGGAGVYGRNSSSGNKGWIGSGSYGVYGKHEGSGDYGYLGGNGIGVLGSSSVGYGVYGSSRIYGVYGANSDSGNYGYLGTGNSGVYGSSSSGNYGQLGTSEYGAYGEHESSGHYGYLGSFTWGVGGFHSSGKSGYLGGATYGVYGAHPEGPYGKLGTISYGAYGFADSGFGVFGHSSSGYGVYGKSMWGDGVLGNADGLGTSGYGVRGIHSGGNYGCLGSSDYGVYGSSSSGYGVYGSSSSSDGVYGTSSSGTGVYGFHNDGNWGYLASDWCGVRGYSPEPSTGTIGVYGYHSTETAGTGYPYYNTMCGVYGRCLYGTDYHCGVQGASYATNSGNRTSGVHGRFFDQTDYWGSLAYKSSINALYGGYFTSYTSGTGKGSPGDEAQTAVGIGSWGDLFGADIHGKIYGIYVEGGNYGLYSHGTVFKDELDVHLQHMEDQSTSVLYTNVSTDVTVQTSGFSTLSTGTCRIEFDDDFKRAVSPDVPIIVTVTPTGNSNGVYVSEVTKDGFTVVENNGGKSTVTVSFIAIGRRAGYENPQLPAEVVSSDYVDKLSRGLHNDAHTETDGEGLYYQDGQLYVGMHPSVLPDPQRRRQESEETEQMKERRRELLEVQERERTERERMQEEASRLEEEHQEMLELHRKEKLERARLIEETHTGGGR